MVSSDLVKRFMAELSRNCHVPLTRSEQDGERLTGIFLSYKIMQAGREPQYQAIEEYKPGSNNTELIHHIKRLCSSVVSITIYAQASRYHEAWALAQSLWDWIESEPGETVIRNLGLAVDFESPAVQDRSSYLETGYETHLGFDIRCYANRETSELTGVIDIPATIPEIHEQ